MTNDFYNILGKRCFHFHGVFRLCQTVKMIREYSATKIRLQVWSFSCSTKVRLQTPKILILRIILLSKVRRWWYLLIVCNHHWSVECVRMEWLKIQVHMIFDSLTFGSTWNVSNQYSKVFWCSQWVGFSCRPYIVNMLVGLPKYKEGNKRNPISS